MTKHTPGPWRVEADYADDTRAEYVIIGADGSCVTYMDGDGNEREDADLIAAAPEMAKEIRATALELSVLASRLAADLRPGHIDYLSKKDAADWCSALSARLAKATGEAVTHV